MVDLTGEEPGDPFCLCALSCQPFWLGTSMLSSSIGRRTFQDASSNLKNSSLTEQLVDSGNSLQERIVQRSGGARFSR